MSILKIGISSRALFDLNESHKIFKEKGIEEYAKYQRHNENSPLEKGVAFALVEKLLRMNKPKDKIVEEQYVQPKVISGSMITPSKTDISNVNLQVVSESGVCIIGQNSDCLVSESTRKPGQIFEVIQLDGMNFNVRYSGPDVRLEKFSILPQSSEDFLPDTNWNVEVLKDDEVSRFYYKVTYKTTQ
ncbi:MAG: 5'-nucleotidase [Nitrosopumilus sp.]